MKYFTQFLLPVILFSLFSLNCQTATGQISVNVHIGRPPVWAPVQYAHRVRYYYFPEYDIYYDALRNGYYYEEGPRWVFSSTLPFGMHESYLGGTENVVVDYAGEHPYLHFSHHRITYLRRFHPHWSRYGWRRPPNFRPQRPPHRPVRPVLPPRPPSRPRPEPARPLPPTQPVRPGRPGPGNGIQPGRPGPGNPGGRPFQGNSRPVRN